MSSLSQTFPSSDSDSTLPPETLVSSSPSPPVDSSNGGNSGNHEMNLSPPPNNEGSSSLSPPPPTENPSISPPPPSSPSTNFNSSVVKSSPPPEASPPPSPHLSPPPSSPPPPSPSSPPPPLSGGNNTSPPPTHGSPSEPSGSPSLSPPPPPLSPNIPAPINNSAVNPPPPHEPTTTTTTPPPPIGIPVVISPPGATPEITTNPILAPPAPAIATPSSDISGTFHPPPTQTLTPTPTSTSTRTPDHSSPSSNSKPEKASSSGESHTLPPSSSSSSKESGTAIGVAVAGVFLLAFIAAIFVVKRRKKRRIDIYAPPYLPPNNFGVKPDGNYYPHNHTGNSGPPEGFYTQVPHTPIGNSFGSQVGTGHNGGGMDSSVINTAKSFFSYEELMEITSGFSRQNILGEGGFGCVFKGWLPDGKPVAVKQLKAGSGQGEREFKAEVEIISRVHHRYLVSLVGYCISDNHRLLIYEYVPNKTLEHHLHGNGTPVLDWANRLKIALGAAKGLAYLHEDCHPKIIHRDIKSANILLDDAFEAQVADFGLAKLTNDTSTHVSTRVMGTFGYMAPEYASSGKLTDRSDVFSFGVVLLELVTGRKPVDQTQPLGDESLVEWARPLLIRALETGDFGELVDPRLGKQYVESEVFRMIEAAAACIRHSAPKRPRMVQVVRALDTESEMSDLSNGVKYGQSTIYESGQYNQDISKFRRMALGSDTSSEYDIYSSGFNSREMPTSRDSWNFQDQSSNESETRAFNGRSGIAQTNQSFRRF